MCRAEGRRCEEKWDNAHRERYNARRRVVRNGEKAAWARTNGNDTKADYYDGLTKDAQAVADKYDAEITAHEADSNNGTAQPALPEWADSSFSSPKTGATYYVVTEERAITMRTAEGQMAGHITWGHDATIGNTNVIEKHQRQGLATEMIRRAREIEPELEHSDRLSSDAQAWIAGMESNQANAQAEGQGAGAERCPECGQFAASSHSCPGAAFRNSAIRDEDGNLLVCHHGASTNFDTWDPEYTGTGNDSWGSGFYFTDDLERAQSYGEHTKSVVLNVTNPIMMDGVAESGMEGFYFTSEQAETILRRHPDIYRQPNDDEEMNPLGDYSQEFFDKDEWSKEEIDGMISRVAKENFDDTSWSNLEGMFPGGKSAEFRRGVQEATGHDGVVTDFKEEGRNVIAWFPEQVHEVGSSSPEPQQETTSASSTPAAEAPKPAAQPKAVSVPQSAGADQAEGGERCGQCGRWVGASHECPQKAELESLRTDSAKWRKSWKKAETEAFVAYGSVLHADINSKLRNNQPLSVDEAKTVRDLDSALARTPQADHERTLFRSFSLSTLRGDAPVDEWVDGRFPEGEVVSLDAYTSVTPNHAVSEEFTGAMSEYTDGGVVMEVRTKQSGYTGESHESEVLLRRGSRFEVVSSSESVEMEGKKFRKVILQEKVSRFGATPSLEHPLAAKPAEPMEIPYIRNTVSSTNHVKNDPQYGQDVEPAGRYLSESGGFTPEGWESGTVRFEKPLHITWGDSGSYTEDDNWKRRLSGFYGGKKGKALSKAVQADGYDAIVTHGEHGTSEIVDLTSMR